VKQLPVFREPVPSLALQTGPAENIDQLCEKCNLHQRARSVCMPADGSQGVGGLLVIGEAPGEQEDRQGRPFVGASGQFLRNELAKHWQGPVVFDHAVRCFPGAKNVTSTHISACRPYLRATFLEAKPQRIICLGGSAIESVVGRSWPVFSIRRGYAYLDDIPVFFVLPPAAALRNRFVRGWFEEDLRWACTAQPTKPPPYGGTAYLIETVADAEQAVAKLRADHGIEYDSLVVDTETFGAHHDHELEIMTLGLAPAGLDYAFVWERDAILDKAMIEPALELLRDPRIPKTGQNAKFDATMIEAYFGVQVKNIDADTQLWRRLIQADAINKLDTMQPLVGYGGGKDEAGEWVDEGIRVLRKMLKKNDYRPDFGGLPLHRVESALDRIADGISPKRYAYAYIPRDVRARYCAADCISTGKLRVEFEKIIRNDEGLFHYWNNLGRHLLYTIGRMEYNGIAISLDAVRHLSTHLDYKIAELERRFKLYTQSEFNPNSPTDVARVLFDELKLPVQGTTKTGKRQVNKEVLTALDHPFCKDVIEYRRWTKFKSNYADPMEREVRDDGRIHPQIRIDGTETGRPSCTEPNLMNIPRAETPEGKMCRDIFVAQPGYVLLEADYNQIELRVAAMLSQDPVMIELFSRGDVDFHLETAKMIAPLLGFKPEEIHKEHPLRSGAKTINFATLYGEPPIATAAKLKISKARAAQMQAAIFGKFKRLKSWIDSQLAFARRHGYVRTWWDNREALIRPLWAVADGNEEIRSTAEKSSWNTPIQGTAATFTNASLCALQQWIEDEMVPTKLVLTVYDSIIQEVREDVVEEVARNTKRIMEQWPSRGVPIVADLKVGRAWGSLEKLKI